MLAHRRPFVAGERAVLAENLRRNGELADVVQQQADAERREPPIDVVEAGVFSA
jgi:hypothetical protein